MRPQLETAAIDPRWTAGSTVRSGCWIGATARFRSAPLSDREQCCGALVDDGRCAGSADIAALRGDFGALTTLDAWLSGPGKPLLDAALQAQDATVALR